MSTNTAEDKDRVLRALREGACSPIDVEHYWRERMVGISIARITSILQELQRERRVYFTTRGVKKRRWFAAA